jgi:hypothetical protein
MPCVWPDRISTDEKRAMSIIRSRRQLLATAATAAVVRDRIA